MLIVKRLRETDKILYINTLYYKMPTKILRVFVFIIALLTNLPSDANTLLTDSINSDNNELELHKDSVWVDKVTGRIMHQQKLVGIDTLVVIKPNPIKALYTDLGIDAAVLAWDRFVQTREYSEITHNVLHQHFSNKPVWDNDSFSGNQFAHPYHGAMCYNAARNAGLSYGASLFYPVLGSLAWEYMCETNEPAINDMLSTGIGGAAVGEVTNRATDIILDDSKVGINRVIREMVGIALNPVRALDRLLSGEMWRVSPSRGKRYAPQPYSIEMGLGYRNMKEEKGNGDNLYVPYIDFYFNYGERFSSNGSKSKPFDLFSISLLANIDSNHPTIGIAEISGRLADIQIKNPDSWSFDFGLYQNLKYVDHYSKNSPKPHNFSMISEAVSFGGGVYAQRETDKICLFNDFMLSAVPFGGSSSDYYTVRRYNYGLGYSIRNTAHFTLNQKASFGTRIYMMQLFTPNGYSPEKLIQKIENKELINTMGDKGHHLIFTQSIYGLVNINKNIRFNIEYEYYRRCSHYKYHDNVKALSHEWKCGFIYSI